MSVFIIVSASVAFAAGAFFLRGFDEGEQL